MWRMRVLWTCLRLGHQEFEQWKQDPVTPSCDKYVLGRLVV